MSALAAGVNKKRKKTETKPQAQINKCNNEKRRREQENIYIEELAELISANIADMSSLSVKPDKCAILQETVNQIRSIKQRESAAQSTDPVQQGEVSSSRPIIISNEVYGPLLLEALEGFLFVVNGEGRVEHVTENVSTYIRFTKEDLEGKSIYNIIHHGDHARFSSSLLPMTIGWNSPPPTNRSRSFNIRLLVKPPDDRDESVEEKQQRVSAYELMYISSTQLRDNVSVTDEDGSESGPCLLCVASRISHRDKTNCSIEQFTTKLDTTGKIICVDTSGVSPNISHFIKKELMDRVLRDLVSPQEVQKVTAHLRETVTNGQATSAVYRLQIASDKYVQVQTKSKLFKTQTPDTDFIMATHSIIGDNEAIGPTDPGGGNTSSGSVGGPLMTSVVNGTARNGGVPVSSGSDSSTTSNNMLNSNTTFSFIENDFNFELCPSSTWDCLDGNTWTTETRPDSRQSVTPVSTPTPRPPSNPSYSPAATTVAQSPLTQFITQQSPSVPNPATPASYNASFFSPLTEQSFAAEEPKDTKANVLEEASMMVESGRLRNLLTQPPSNMESAADSDNNRNRDRILKELLKQDDDDGARNDNRTSPRGHHMSRPMQSNMEQQKTSSSTNGNNMLRQLLNDKNDDDDLEAKAGVKKKSELLQQLLKTERDVDDDKNASQDDNLLQSLGFSSRGKKRPSDDREDNPNKRNPDGTQVSSSGQTTSKLWESNKMLAQLLAQQPKNHQPIPPIPASEITATPQDKLPRITDQNAMNKSLQMNMMNQQNIMNNSRMAAARMPNRAPPTTNYLSNQLQAPVNIQRTENRQINQVTSGCFTSPATSSTDNNNTWDNNNVQSADPELSVILDQVIDNIPDEFMQILDTADGAPTNSVHQTLSETMAINMIQRNLMQCESVVKSPVSPTISLPNTPPAYTASLNNQSGFSAPPQYAQIKRQIRPGATVYPTNNNLTPQQIMLQQKNKLQQEQHKRRLLQAQKQQHLLIPSNATSADLNSIQNIDNLLNNTVAPNVSLQRSSSVPESQLSPNYQQQMGQNQRISNQQPYSPHSQLTSPIGQQSGFPQTTVGNYPQPGARLSPQSQFNQQLSPRQAYPQNPNWQQQQRISVQQNPMLNQQLAGNFLTGGRNFQRAPVQRGGGAGGGGMSSPGGAQVSARHSPYPPDQFQAPVSPGSAYQQQQQNQYLRLQRANSAPTATTQLPGGLGSPRPYPGRDHHPLPYSQIPPPQHNTHHPMMYQQETPQYCYDQSGLQLPYNGADRGRAPPHLQPGVTGGGGGAPTSEFVRQELRAVVGARTAQAQPSGAAPRQPQQQQQGMLQQQVTPDLDGLALGFDMATGASDNPKLWGAMGSDMGSMSPQPATSRTTMEEAVRQGDHKSSLLQKLLSE
ncbi:nuclear receptor coactivator 1 isoform X2 [Aethina tumida]|nr:nuclear receptor coactivator 1 isoform X2 [Aethina tumida]